MTQSTLLTSTLCKSFTLHHPRRISSSVYPKVLLYQPFVNLYNKVCPYTVYFKIPHLNHVSSFSSFISLMFQAVLKNIFHLYDGGQLLGGREVGGALASPPQPSGKTSSAGPERSICVEDYHVTNINLHLNHLHPSLGYNLQEHNRKKKYTSVIFR